MGGRDGTNTTGSPSSSRQRFPDRIPGLLVYFGYPQAHEDDAQRAGLVGLGILAAMEPLKARLEQERGVWLAVRVGVHTGPVVVGTMGGGNRQEQLALADTPNIAARLQGLGS